MNAGSSNHEQRSRLYNTSSLTQRERQKFAQIAGCGCRRNEVEGLFRTSLVRPTIEDQLPRAIRELAQFQSSALTLKERIVLGDLDRPAIGKRCHRTGDPIQIADPYFDFNVPCHL